MSDRFGGWSVLVTGAASGIGAATAERFHSEGAVVTGVDLDDQGLERRAEQLGARFKPVRADVGTAAGRSAAIEAATGADGALNVLVNNAGVFVFAGEDATEEQWRRTLDVNLLAPALLVAEALPALRRARTGEASVVHVASISGYIAQPRRWTYNTSKGGLLQLTRSQAFDLGKEAIRVNSVSPGWVWTAVLEEASGGDRERWERVWGEYCPMGRCAEPGEIAAVIAFLASPDASFITGADLPVDGGYLTLGGEGMEELKGGAD
jgi:NAD(P)-dependent dehydrogenase (short-subunit alcohol dehydrogenase family)